MDGSFFSHRTVMIVLLAAAAGLAGCSGSSGSASAGDDPGDRPPPGQPPADDPPADDPPNGDDGDDGDGVVEPAVTLSAADTVVPAGETVVLTWSSSHATSCVASGGWSGNRPVQGSVEVGPLNQNTTYSLNCSGPGGNALDMLSVSVLGVVSLEWEPPTENVDGSSIDDLSGYRIYYGPFSRDYSSEVAVDDERTTAHQLVLPSGSYYFAMTAVDVFGNESSYSNEVIKTVN